ncbi:DNA polymerase III subunit beta family protein [Qaidamihabitans albus]|uniref:DNA polymerase III subunit beta family protein n=1 Tax=Qaidamihabitans albus TaxID=2795733 RepID=UPI0018F20964|nr:MerR family transcriptional regulator [Qaidamihabitans albus]
MHSISAFARRVGLTPSALRFYDDCSILKPARVDEQTGYRFYSPDQERRAVLLRDLRAAGVPLAEVGVVLDGPPAEARAVLRAHARTLRAEAEAAHAALAEVLRSLPDDRHTEVRLGGPELASAVRQVVPAAADGGEIPELGCVLIEVTGAVLRLVATDRYRLAVRELRPHGVEGTRRTLLVRAPFLVEVSGWAPRLAAVTLLADEDGARLLGGGSECAVPLLGGEFPAYREVLAGLSTPTHRVLTDRTALLRSLATVDSDRVVLSTGDDRLRVDGTDLAALCSGPPLRIAFDPAVLGPALEASVGPDVLLEIAGEALPTVVRSADQGSFTTLVMPVSLD